MIEGMVVAGYLSLVAAKAAGRLVDRRLDAGLEALVRRVRAKFGRDPAMDLARNPDRQMHERVAAAIEAAAYQDPHFGTEVDGIVRRLDQLGGRNVIYNMQRTHTQQHYGAGDIAGRDIYRSTHHISAFPGDPSNSPVWVKAMIVLGTIVGLAGFAILGIGIANMPDGPGQVTDPWKSVV